MEQLHRRYYTFHLCVLERLYHSRPSKNASLAFVEKFQPETVRLPVFAEIHALGERDAEFAALDLESCESEEIPSASNEFKAFFEHSKVASKNSYPKRSISEWNFFKSAKQHA